MEQIERKGLIDQLSAQTTKEEFELLVGGILTEGDRKMFGENAASAVAQAIIYPAAFAIYPATMDTVAYGSVIDDIMAEQMSLPEKERFPDIDRVARLLEISIEQGIVEMREDGRLYIPTQVHEKIYPILSQYD